jgi:hypothetical protein
MATEYFPIQNNNKIIEDTVNNMVNVINGKILYQQNDMKKIIDSEALRLQEKKKSIELIETSQKRLISLNENFNKKNYEYIKMMIFTASGLAIIGILIFLGINSNIVTMITIIIISSIVIFCASSYIDIASRDSIYFDEININTPDNTFSPNTNNNINKSTSLLSPLLCIGGACCSPETAWNTDSNQCELIRK